ncbi:MAG: response regulator [Elusimicrobia bacterium]|nr:response regulator [Elusimicrobiota bacterium]
MRETIAFALTSKGYEVIRAKEGAGGLDVALKEKPALVLLDIRLPGEMDGWDVLSSIRADPEMNTLPVLMLTTINELGEIEKTVQLGATDYITKPFNVERLLEKVKKLIGDP